MSVALCLDAAWYKAWHGGGEMLCAAKVMVCSFFLALEADAESKACSLITVEESDVVDAIR